MRFPPPPKLIDLRSPEELVEWLDHTFPPRCIGENESETHAHRYAGKRDLIEYLKTRMKREKEKYGITT